MAIVRDNSKAALAWLRDKPSNIKCVTTKGTVKKSLRLKIQLFRNYPFKFWCNIRRGLQWWTGKVWHCGFLTRLRLILPKHQNCDFGTILKMKNKMGLSCAKLRPAWSSNQRLLLWSYCRYFNKNIDFYKWSQFPTNQNQKIKDYFSPVQNCSAIEGKIVSINLVNF